MNAAGPESGHRRGALKLIMIAVCLLQACSTKTSLPLPGRISNSPAVRIPAVSGSVIGPRETIFDTQNSCELIDVPDAPTRAFRDARGMVHLFSSHYVARAMIGPDFSHLRHDCHVVYRSPLDADPADFQYKNWLFSFYSEDGLKIAALVHSEYDAEEIPGMCATPQTTDNCWWNTVTFAQSRDGGYTFSTPGPPQNLVAALPYRYFVGNRASASGYNGPTNIMTKGGFFYALIGDWPYKSQRYGPCLIRTSNVFDPKSWRAWDGSDFTIQFIDPYRVTAVDVEKHICPPVFAGSAEALVQEVNTGYFVTVQIVPDSRFDGPPGFYVQASPDLIHWSKPVVVMRFRDLEAEDGPGKWIYGDESLLDPDSTDRNFATISDTPYLYYVRSDGDHLPYVRKLLRHRIRLRITIN